VEPRSTAQEFRRHPYVSSTSRLAPARRSRANARICSISAVRRPCVAALPASAGRCWVVVSCACPSHFCTKFQIQRNAGPRRRPRRSRAAAPWAMPEPSSPPDAMTPVRAAPARRDDLARRVMEIG
jgi:hypothetical protein